ncbi:hypothetical protein ACOT7R_08675 [Clostridium perfringens]|uniref:hypothetical protein n=1 Tax=Clostridium perfringens TaxID=1502 RepID=UPI003BA89C33
MDKEKKELLRSLMGSASSKEVDFNKVRYNWKYKESENQEEIDKTLFYDDDDYINSFLDEKDSIFNRDTELTEEGLDNLISQMERAKELSKHESKIDIEENMREGREALSKFLENRNRVITIREDKVEEFLNQKRDDEMWKKIKERARIFRKNNLSSISNDKCEWDIITNIFKNAIKKKGMTEDEIKQKVNNILKDIRKEEIERQRIKEEDEIYEEMKDNFGRFNKE